jgi:hypothetical protein
MNCLIGKAAHIIGWLGIYLYVISFVLPLFTTRTIPDPVPMAVTSIILVLFSMSDKGAK